MSKIYDHLMVFSLVFMFGADFSIRETNISSMPIQQDRIDSFYCDLLCKKIDTIFQYKELNQNTGIRGVIIWKKNNEVHGVKWISNRIGETSSEIVITDVVKLNALLDEYFKNINETIPYSRSSLETMHDFDIEIQSNLCGKSKKITLLNSQIINDKEFLSGVTKLCKSMIYDNES